MILNLYLGFSKKTHPNFTDVPHQLTLRITVVQKLRRVVAILLLLSLQSPLTNGMPQPPNPFFPNHIGKFKLTRHDLVGPKIDESINNPENGLN